MFIYVASPYNHPDAAIRELRCQAVQQYVAMQLRHNSDGITWYSPIAHSHSIAVRFLHRDEEQTAKFWRPHNYAMLRRASALEVLMLPGWEESVGVTDEIRHAALLGISIRHKIATGSYEAKLRELAGSL